MHRKKKTTAGKAKKLLRRAETEQLQQSSAAVKDAQEEADLLQHFPAFKTYDRQGLKAGIVFYRSESLPASLRQWAFDLCKRNMQALYEATWGWRDDKKLAELENEDARFLVALEPDVKDVADSALAYIHFRFEHEEGLPVLYVYEIQLEAKCRRKGLGKLLMKLMELVALKMRMQAVMLTVTKANTSAVALYSSLGYTQHPSSPDSDLGSEIGYTILHKSLVRTA